jgi:hypothetical protein
MLAALMGVSAIGSTKAHAATFCAPPLMYTVSAHPGLSIVKRTNCGNTREIVGTFPDEPIISPNQKLVAWIEKSPPSLSRLHVAAIDGTSDHVITEGTFTTVAWSPGSDRLVYGEFHDLAQAGVYTIRPDGSAKSLLVGPISGSFFSFAWSNSGKNIAYIRASDNGENYEIVLTDAQGTTPRVLYSSSSANLVQDLAWGPDDSYLIFSESPGGDDFKSKALRINIAGGTTTEIPTVGGGAHAPHIGPGSALAYMTSGPYGNRIAVQPMMDSTQAVFFEGSSNDTINAANNPVFAPGVVTPQPTPTPTPTPSPKPSCPTLQFFGLRGSGEKFNDSYGGMGKTVDWIKRYLASQIPGMKSAAVNYPAIPVKIGSLNYPVDYTNSELKGATNLDDAFHRFITQCPKTYVVVAGYSQGADAVGDAFGWLNSAEKKHIAAVVMFGDPVFNPRQPSADHGDYSSNLSGILVKVFREKPRVFLGVQNNLFLNFCTRGDPVCNFSAGNSTPTCLQGKPACPHLRYVERGWTKLAASWTLSHWRALPVLK